MIHSVFLVSMLRKFLGDLNSIVPLDDMSFPIEILDQQVKRLRIKELASVKVLWKNQKVESVTWE